MCSVLNVLNGVILPCKLESNSSRALTEKEMCVFSVNWSAKDRRDEGGESPSLCLHGRTPARAQVLQEEAMATR